MACLFSVIDSSTRKSASSRDKVATACLGVEAGVDGGAACDGFVMGEAYEYASGLTGIWIVAAAFEYSTCALAPQCRSCVWPRLIFHDVARHILDALAGARVTWFCGIVGDVALVFSQRGHPAAARDLGTDPRGSGLADDYRAAWIRLRNGHRRRAQSRRCRSGRETLHRLRAAGSDRERRDSGGTGVPIRPHATVPDRVLSRRRLPARHEDDGDLVPLPTGPRHRCDRGRTYRRESHSLFGACAAARWLSAGGAHGERRCGIGRAGRRRRVSRRTVPIRFPPVLMEARRRRYPRA